MQISEAFSEVVELSRRMGVSRINQLPGCWEVEVGNGFRIAVNGHDKPTPCTFGPEVPPFEMYVERNGLPAGLISPDGGTVVGDCEDALIEALKLKTK